MKIFSTIEEWRTFRQTDFFQHKSLGFAPTMGNLHAGHQSLLTRAKKENDLSILSIFINPTQFNNADDLKNYPKTLATDLNMAEQCGIDIVLLPTYDMLYPDNYRYQIHETELSKILCGKSRPGHFTGMLTVVLKLLLLVQANRAYFGEKDYQQLQLVKGLVDAFFVETDIIACPIIRNSQGLALSSRNNLLTSDQLTQAARFPALLQARQPIPEIVQQLTQAGFEVDYIEEHAGRRFGAVKLGPIRLIDNIPIPI